MTSAKDPPKPKFKATRLWNNLVKSFRESIATKRHRWRLKAYENSFTGTEAVDCLYDLMQWTGTFGNVTRLQATRLCQKFVDMRIVEDVRKTANGRFFDDGHLYQFVESHVSSPASRLASRRVALSTVVVANTHAKLDKTPGKRKRRAKVEEEIEEEEDDDSVIPMIIENSHADPHAIEMKEMNFGDAAIPEDVGRLWKEVTLERLLRYVDLPKLDGIFESDAVNGRHIASNANRIAKIFMSKPRHLVEDAPKAIDDVLPYWVLSAMDFLKKWPHGDPEECGFTLPIYEGFEKDVLVAIGDYFRCLPQSLIPFSMFRLHNAILDLMQRGKSTSGRALQLASLLLPPRNRAQLLHLFTFMGFLCVEGRFALSKDRTNRHVLLTMFSTVVLRSCPKPSQNEQDKVRVLISFMLDNYTEIFTVPEDLEAEVKHRIKASDGTSGKTFCQKISKEEYNQQTRTASDEAISQLLDGILSNTQLSRKEKKKKLIEFQRVYPFIYRRRFPSDAVQI